MTRHQIALQMGAAVLTVFTLVMWFSGYKDAGEAVFGMLIVTGLAFAGLEIVWYLGHHSGEQQAMKGRDAPLVP